MKRDRNKKELQPYLPWENVVIESSWQVRHVASRPAAFHWMMEKCIRRDMEVATLLGRETVVDVLLPVGESLEELQQLIGQINRTNLKIQLLFLDDCIQSKEVLAAIDRYIAEDPSAKVVHNERKIGIVSSINRGLVISRSDYVVLLGAKVTLPPYWLERLVMPMIKDATVASATPFTNHGLIAGFPVPNLRNRLFDDETVEETDKTFQKVRSLYTTVPYGVGFCMAMSREVIHKIGILNQQMFTELDGADIDWALRAAQAGYRNVMAENLYVKNDRFSTDMLEGERMLSMKQEKIVRRESPDYQKVIDSFEAEDPLTEIRAYAFSQIVRERAARRRILFHQEGDPSADRYMRRYIEEKLKENEAVLTVEYSQEASMYLAALEYDSYRVNFSFSDLGEVLEMAEALEARRVVVGKITGLPKVRELLQSLRRYADDQGSRLVIMLLDYFSICPAGNMFDVKTGICSGQSELCAACKAKMTWAERAGFENILTWRQMWKEFLRDAQEILYYSDRLLEIMEQYFGVLEKVHKIEKPSENLEVVGRNRKMRTTVRVLIPGPLTKETGLEYVKELVKQANKDKMDMRFLLRGECEQKALGKLVKLYPADDNLSLPAFILKHDIDICLIPDEAPDAIGMRAEIITETGIPAVCRNIGETAYVIERYEKGLILSDSLQRALYQIKELSDKYTVERSDNRSGVVFVSDEGISSTAVEGMEELLWKHGVRTHKESVDSMLIRSRHQGKYIILDGCHMSRRLRLIMEDRLRAEASLWYLCVRTSVPDEKEIRQFAEYCKGFLVENIHDRDLIRKLLPEARIQLIKREWPMRTRLLSKAIMKNQRGRDRWHLYAGSDGIKRPENACVVGWMHNGGKDEKFSQDICMEVIASIEEVMKEKESMRLLVSERIMLDRNKLRLRERMLPVDDLTQFDRLMLLSQCDVLVKPVILAEEPISQSEELAEMAGIPVVKETPEKIGEALKEYCIRQGWM